MKEVNTSLGWVLIIFILGCQPRVAIDLPPQIGENKGQKKTENEQEKDQPVAEDLFFVLRVDNSTDTIGGPGGLSFGSSKDPDQLYNHYHNQIKQGQVPGITKLRILGESAMAGGVFDNRLAQIYQNDFFGTYPDEYNASEAGFSAGVDNDDLTGTRESIGEIDNFHNNLITKADVCQVSIDVTGGNTGVYISGLLLQNTQEETYAFGNTTCKGFKHFETDEFEILQEEENKQQVQYSQRPENTATKKPTEVIYERFTFEAPEDSFIAGISGRAGHAIDGISFVTVSWQPVLPEQIVCPADENGEGSITSNDFSENNDCLYFKTKERDKPHYLANGKHDNNAYCLRGKIFNISKCERKND